MTASKMACAKLFPCNVGAQSCTSTGIIFHRRVIADCFHGIWFSCVQCLQTQSRSRPRARPVCSPFEVPYSGALCTADTASAAHFPSLAARFPTDTRIVCRNLTEHLKQVSKVARQQVAIVQDHPSGIASANCAGPASWQITHPPRRSSAPRRGCALSRTVL